MGKVAFLGREAVLAAPGRAGEKSDFSNSLLEDKRNSKRNMARQSGKLRSSAQTGMSRKSTSTQPLVP